MRDIIVVLTVLLVAPRAGLAADSPRPGNPQQQWVAVGASGKLEYKTTARGDRIIDFSHAGYMGGGVAIPALPVKKEMAPSGGDDAPAIQAAIDALAALPPGQGGRGAVLLKPGVFRCSKPITLAQAGVVLRGSGAGPGGTVIEMTGEPHTAIVIEGSRVRTPKEDSASALPIADACVPSGALSLSLKSTSGLAAGDTVLIRWPRTAKWIAFMNMDHLVRDGKPQTWIKADSPTAFERIVRRVEGNRITLDVPLTDAIDNQLLAPDAAVVVKIPPPRRLSQCGVEALRINSPPPTGTLIAKNNLAIAIDHCADCWVKDVAMHDTLGNVAVGGAARRITIVNASAVHTATVEKGAGYPADFSIRGQQVLIDRCSSSGDGSFYVATLNAEATLNVVLNCDFKGKGAIQPHMRWSTGLLVDSCRLPDGRIEFINRKTAGSGHGWAIGWSVAWNSTAKTLQLELPPGAMNWCIGCKGELHKSCAREAIFCPDKPVVPASLYLAQLRDRLGKAALTNIGY